MAPSQFKLHALVLSILVLAPLPMPLASAADPPYEVTPIGGARLPLSANATTLLLADDEVTSAFGLGFTTKFFGRATDLFWVGSNGFVTLHFLTPAGCCEGDVIPTPGGPDGMIAGWWTDLDPSAGGTIRFDRQTVEGQPALVVDYDHVPLFGDPTATATFQIVLLRSGVFEVRIEEAASVLHATVGAEDINGRVGVQAFRAEEASVTDAGFRFTPVVVPVPPPQLASLSTSSAAPGTTVLGFGADFASDAFVLVGGTATPSHVFNATTLIFLVPTLPDGTYDVTVGHPDGNTSTLAQALTIEDRLFVDGLDPNPVRQRDTFFVSGGGFEPGLVLRVGATELPATVFSRTLLQATIPPQMPPGVYDVSVTTALGTAFSPTPLTVLGRPDLVLASLDATRHAPPEPFGVAPEYPEPWTVRVAIENAGDAEATDVEVAVELRPTTPLLLASPPERHVRAFATLAAGDSREVVLDVGEGTEVGDWTIVASVTTRGAGDRNLSNNVRAHQATVGVGGFGGASVDACGQAPNACMPPEERSHRLEEREQRDVHEDATLHLQASMASADFDFDQFPIVFTSFESLPDGFRECTTWRFLGGASGTFRVTMEDGNGLSGLASLPSAANRTSDGSHRTTTWTDTRAFGVILAESDRTTTSEAPSEPFDAYEFADGFSWSLVATGLTGDFTHCAVRDGDDSHEEFTFAALPADPSVFVASFDGVGFADEVRVDVHGETDHQESRPLL